MQPFLRKIFEGINSLEFQVGLWGEGGPGGFQSRGQRRAATYGPLQRPPLPSPASAPQPDGAVTAMCSEEGERVPFAKSFNPLESAGNVERWLIECEIAMRSTLKDAVDRSFGDYARRPRIDWVTAWPGQVVLAVDCIYWTREAGDAIARHSLGDYAQACTEELMKASARGAVGALSAVDAAPSCTCGAAAVPQSPPCPPSSSSSSSSYPGGEQGARQTVQAGPQDAVGAHRD